MAGSRCAATGTPSSGGQRYSAPDGDRLKAVGSRFALVPEHSALTVVRRALRTRPIMSSPVPAAEASRVSGRAGRSGKGDPRFGVGRARPVPPPEPILTETPKTSAYGGPTNCRAHARSSTPFRDDLRSPRQLSHGLLSSTRRPRLEEVSCPETEATSVSRDPVFSGVGGSPAWDELEARPFVSTSPAAGRCSGPRYPPSTPDENRVSHITRSVGRSGPLVFTVGPYAHVRDVPGVCCSGPCGCFQEDMHAHPGGGPLASVLPYSLSGYR